MSFLNKKKNISPTYLPMSVGQSRERENNSIFKVGLSLNLTTMDAGMDSDSTCSSLSQILKKVLPKMEEDKLNLVLRRFSELGVETATDLHLLQESDLLDTLKPIQIRKLLLEVHGKYCLYLVNQTRV